MAPWLGQEAKLGLGARVSARAVPGRRTHRASTKIVGEDCSYAQYGAVRANTSLRFRHSNARFFTVAGSFLRVRSPAGARSGARPGPRSFDLNAGLALAPAAPRFNTVSAILTPNVRSTQFLQRRSDLVLRSIVLVPVGKGIVRVENGPLAPEFLIERQVLTGGNRGNPAQDPLGSQASAH